jgi:WD40 repeat protein
MTPRRACLSLLFALLATPAPAQQAPRSDALGDPLPAGAGARLGTARLYHPRACVAFSLDGRHVITAGGNDTQIHFWDAATGKELRRIDCPTAHGSDAGVLTFAPSPDGRLLALGKTIVGPDDNLFVCAAATGKVLWQAAAHAYFPIDLRFVNGGKTLVSVGNEGTVCWWDVASGKKLRTWNAAGLRPPGKGRFVALRRATLSPDGKGLAAHTHWQVVAKTPTDAQPEVVAFVDLVAGEERWRSAALAERDAPLRFSPDGKYLATSEAQTTGPALYETATGKLVKRLMVPGKKEAGEGDIGQALFTLAFAADGKTVTAGFIYRSLCVWDVATGKVVRQFRPEDLRFHDFREVALSPDGTRLLAVADRKMELWDVATGKELVGAAGHGGPVNHLQFAADGKQLLSVDHPAWSEPRELLRWDVRTWTPRQRLGANELSRTVEVVCVSPDHGVEVVRKGAAGDVVVRARGTGKEICTLDVKYPVGRGGRGFLSPSNRLVVMSAPEQELEKSWLLDATTGQRRCPLPIDVRHLGFAFAPDDSAVAWWERDGTLQVVDAGSGKPLGRFRAAPPLNPDALSEVQDQALAFAPDGRYLASWRVTDNAVHVWDVVKGKEHRRLPGQGIGFGFAARAVCLTFAPDGRTLAVGGMAGANEIQVWELATGQVRLRLSGHRGPVTALAFSPDCRLLASGSADTTVLIWDLLPNAKGTP